MLTFAYSTGWRWKSEVATLAWAQVDLSEGRVELPKGTTKNGEGRRIYLTPELRAVLDQQWSEHLTLFPACEFVFHRNGKCIRDFRGAWKQACGEARLPTDRIPHDFRRTAIRNMVRAGIAEQVAMDMSGHKTRAVFDRYNITSDGDLKEAARSSARRLRPRTMTTLMTIGRSKVLNRS